MALRCKHGPKKSGTLPEPAPIPDRPGSHSAGQTETNEGEHSPALICRICRSRITRRDLAMQVDGSHGHVFFNPQGQVFELGCFASAGNILPTGPKTEEFTWFPGFAWQAVACTGCLAQVGWRFTGGDSGFFGLILTALVEDMIGKP